MKTYLCTAIVLAAMLLGGCGSKGAAQNDGNTAAAPQASTEKAPERKPVVTCVPVKAKAEAQSKATAKKPVKGKAPAKTKPAASTTNTPSSPNPVTAPVSPNADGTCPVGTEAVITQPEPAAPASTAPAKTETSSNDGSPRMVKSKDGSFEGEVYGSPAAGSKLAKIQIGMTQEEVERIMGHPNNSRSYVTGKAFNPFYFGTDAARIEWVYRGYGSVAFDAGRWGGGGVVMMINHDPKIQ